MSARDFSLTRWLVFGALLLSACSTDSCGCEGFEQRAFPPTKQDVTIPAVGQARITASGLDFVEAQVPYLIEQFQPDGLSFCLPRDTSGNPDICVSSTCSNGQNGCQIDLTLDDQSITPVPTDTLEVDITIGDVNERLNFDYDATLFTVNCYVQLFKDGSSEDTPATVAGSVPIRLFVDQASDFKEVGIDVGDVEVDLSDVDFKIHGRGNVADTVTCEGASLVRGLFRGMIEDEIRGALESTVAGLRRDQLCRHCGTDFDPCPNGATCANDGVCEYSADQCVPRTLGIEGRLNVGSLLGEFVREPAASVDVLAKAADLARVDTGVSVGLRGGAEPNASSQCVPVDPTERPPIRTVPASQAVTGDERPGGEPFMLGVGLHKSAMEQILWSVWASGGTCLEVSDEDVMVISTTAFSLVAPSIKDLARNGRSAVLAVVANSYPTVELGANTVMPDGDTYTITDPLLRLLWEDVDFHVFAYAQDRMLRLFTLRLDLDIPVAIVPDGLGNLTPVIPAIEDAIANIEPRGMELLSETPEEIRELVPTLLGIAAPQLADAIPGAFELPEFIGFRVDLQQGDITSVDSNNFIAIFADLARTNQPYTSFANTAIMRQDVSYDRVLSSGFVRPEVTLDVRGYRESPLTPDGDYEFSWRVDRGFWSHFHRTDTLVVDDPVLAIPGSHRIEVRAREVGEPGTTDPTPAVTDVNIEWEATPTEEEPAEEGRAQPAVKELGDVEREQVLSVIGDRRDLEVEPGPTAPPSDTMSPPDDLAPQASAPAGCQTGAGGLSLAAILLFGIAAASRRRRRRIVIVALVLATWGCKGGCKGELQTNADEFCFGPECNVDQACEVDSDCAGICPEGSGGICEEGACQCVTACQPGCGEEEFCCLSTSECVSYAGLCDETACEPGYEPGVLDAVPNRESCELTDFMCDCVPLPPLSAGWHGPYTSIDSDGNLTVVATYNDEYGDLMLGEVAADGTVTWHYVAGVPETGEITGDPSGPRGGIAERGADAGTHTAVAIGDDGTVHVVYRDEDADAMMWGRATFGGGDVTFESEVVDDAASAGHWPSAAVLDGEVHVVYAAPELDSGGSALRHVVLGGTPTDLATDDTVDESDGYPEVVGAFADLTAAADALFLVYWNGVTNRVGRMQYDGMAWTEPTFIAEGTGPWASGMRGDGELEHVVFQQNQGFRYSRFGDVQTSRVHDGVRDGGDEYWFGTTGEDSSVRVDGSTVTVAYQNTFGRTLVVTTSTDGATWTPQSFAVDGAGSGLWVAMTRRGTPFVADMVVDRREEPQAFVRVTPLR